MNSWKYSVIFPLLVIFAMTFNTKTIAQTSDVTSATATDDHQNILKFVVTKDTKDKQLNFIKHKLADKGATVSFNNVKRNSKNEITTIKTKFKYKGSNGLHVKKSSEPINPIEISINLSADSINVGEQTSTLSQTFDVDPTDNTLAANSEEKNINETKLFTNSENSPLVISDGEEIVNEEMNAIDPKTIESIQVLKGENASKEYGKKGKNGVILVTTKTGTKNGQLITNNQNDPLYIVDGKEITKPRMEAIKPNAIASISILKDEKATKIYGEKGENGVVLITTKKEGLFKTDDGELISIANDEDQKLSIIPKSDNGKTPLYIMDGKEINKTQMEAINPNNIASVFILKDESATKKYGEKGENGVVIITSKKE